MSAESRSCQCGAGSETVTFEMDDWNRTRTSSEIHCAQCQEKKQRELEGEEARERRRDELLESAQQLATERYLSRWLALFGGMTTKAAWQLYTGGSGYPALATFYQHVKHTGSLSKYMEWCLARDLERSLSVLGTEDKEIDDLLKERSRLWGPTSGPM